MDSTLIAALMFPALFVLVFLGLPVAFSLIAIAFFAGLFAFGELLPIQMFSRLIDASSSYSLAAVPLFIFMGSVLERSGIAERLFLAMQLWLGRLPGGLAVASIAMAGIFAAATGIVGAVEAVIGLMAIPPMLRYGYDKGLISGTICAGGSLGTMIPPSIVVIIYGAVGQISIGQLFAGVLVPGGLMVVFFLGYIVVRCALRPGDGPPAAADEVAVPLGEKLRVTIVSLVPATALIIAVLGSILLGIASPTEAAAVGALGALILAGLYRSLDPSTMVGILRKTVRINAMILLIVVGGSMFTSMFYFHGGGQLVSGTIDVIAPSQFWLIIILLLITFVFGFVLDWISVVLICLPIFDGLIRAAGVDPLWFGIMMIIVIQTSYLTPPMAPAIFYLRSIAPPEITYFDMFRGVLPFVFCQVLVLLVVAFMPWTATWLPSLMGH